MRMNPKRTLKPYVRAALLMALPWSAGAWAWAALPAYNQHTLARSFALPVIGQASVLGASQSAFSADDDLTSEYYKDQRGNEDITVDGETSGFTLGWRQGIGNDVELTARVPEQIVGGGFMDHFIDNWHKTFGLPDGGRSQAPDNQRQISYSVNGNPVLDVPASGTTLGDIQLGAGYQFDDHAVVRGMV